MEPGVRGSGTSRGESVVLRDPALPRVVAMRLYSARDGTQGFDRSGKSTVPGYPSPSYGNKELTCDSSA